MDEEELAAIKAQLEAQTEADPENVAEPVEYGEGDADGDGR